MAGERVRAGQGMMGGIESGQEEEGAGGEFDTNGNGKSHDGWDLRVPLAYNNK